MRRTRNGYIVPANSLSDFLRLMSEDKFWIEDRKMELLGLKYTYIELGHNHGLLTQLSTGDYFLQVNRSFFSSGTIPSNLSLATTGYAHFFRFLQPVSRSQPGLRLDIATILGDVSHALALPELTSQFLDKVMSCKASILYAWPGVVLNVAILSLTGSGEKDGEPVYSLKREGGTMVASLRPGMEAFLEDVPCLSLTLQSHERAFVGDVLKKSEELYGQLSSVIGTF